MTFPVLEAILHVNNDTGKIGICTNSIAPGLVFNEIDNRDNVCVLGSLRVNKDGTERMIVNSLSHPSLKFLVLFGEESVSFKPSTNLLLALMNGYSNGRDIKDSVGISAEYPSISEELLEEFRKNIIVIPAYRGDKETVLKYLDWLKGKVSSDLISFLEKIYEKKKIYYDSLNELVDLLAKEEVEEKNNVELDVAEFQNLQPPVIELGEVDVKEEVSFLVSREENLINVRFICDGKGYFIEGEDPFLIGYSLMKHFDFKVFSDKEYLLLGAEMSRIEMEIKHGIEIESFVLATLNFEGEMENIPLANSINLEPDKRFYYVVGLKEGKIFVQSLAYQDCELVFELRSKDANFLIDEIAKQNRFDKYSQETLHRIDVGIEIGRAGIALAYGKIFVQDFRYLSDLNETKFPFFLVDGKTFLENHKKMIMNLYTQGLTQQHPDTHKGPMRTACILSVFRKGSLEKMPKIYFGTDSEENFRRKYKEQLQNPENEGAYTYGERTREYFGFDQLDDAVFKLKENGVYVIQRFDFEKDMGVTEENGKKIYTHDPCLTHDIYFILENKLYSFHIARAHNIVNAYPSNIFGLYDAYDKYISEKLGIELGDFYMLSNRGNILLLTEEQKAKQIIAEPSKVTDRTDCSIGPHNLSNGFSSFGVGYLEQDLAVEEECLHDDLLKLENYNGINLIDRAVNYLSDKGNGHNNPILGTYNPLTGDTGRLIFFQANVRCGKIEASAVFVNGSDEVLSKDLKLCNYISTIYSRQLGFELGKLRLFYVPYRKC